jgi:alginate O-acetyltransferase complex protein AlgI
VLSHVYCLLAALFGWILFHFTDIRLGWTVFADLFGAYGNPLSDFVTRTLLGNKIFLLLFSALACTPLISSLGKRLDLRFGEARAWRVLRDCLVPVALLLLSTCMLVGESYNPFLYFQF